MIADAARSVWTAPPAPGAPGPLRRDQVLVAVLVTAAVVEAALRPGVVWRPVALLQAVGLAFALPWRRTHPLAVLTAAFGVALLIGVAASLAGVGGDIGLYTTAYMLLLPYALYRWGSGRELVLGTAIALVSVTAGVLRDGTPAPEILAGFVVLSLPAVLGLSVRNGATARRRELEQVRSREREQLARELHDTVAHHVSAMVIRAQAGRVVAGSRPAAAVEALQLIEAEGSRTLAQMRAMVGALRAGDDADLAPVGGLADLERLARDVGDGPPVRVSLAHLPDGVSRPVEAALYRIAQEAVTNARRHARHAGEIVVQVRGQDDGIRLTVRDDGDPVPAGRGAEGYGLVGMAERAKLLGGSLRAGPGPDGGWVVEAELPRAGAGE